MITKGIAFRLSVQLWCSFGLFAWNLNGQTVIGNVKRKPTVADSIQMTRLANPDYLFGAWAKPKVAEFSPDGKRFVVALRRGNLDNNTNEFSLLLFQTANALSTLPPQVLVTLSSPSNRPAIQRVTWLGDNETIAFLGEQPGDTQQVYMINCKTQELRKLTNHPTNILAYSMTSNGGTIAFVAEKQEGTFLSPSAQRNGIRVTTQWVTDLIAGEYRDRSADNVIFVKNSHSREPKRITVSSPLAPNTPLRLSPDGRYVLALTQPRAVPAYWREYDDDRLRRLQSRGLRQYMMVDTTSGESRPLMDSPIGAWSTEADWSPDSHSVIVTGVYLPLQHTDPKEREARRAHTFAVEVRVPTLDIAKLPDGDLRLIRWDSGGKVLFESGRMNALLGKETPRVAYRREASVWVETGVPTTPEDSVEVLLNEDLNSPPRIVVIDTKSGKRYLLMDLNPQFDELNLAKVEHVRWKATDGHDVEGGLYLPPDFVQGKKYPLVLQTHGFNPQRFWMDGPWATAFAAQALASKGIIVLQIPDWPNLDVYPKLISTQAEAPYQLASYEGAIDYLDSRGLIDRDRIGIIGFSRSSFYVKFALTHSKYKFAAASITDGIDAGYFQYLAFSNVLNGPSPEYDSINGSCPFGEGLHSWLRLSPGFGLQEVGAAVRIEALGRASLLGEWEWFSGLLLLRKPVELVYQPNAEHIIERPWERLVSQQGNVDWFCFWLKGEEDSDPAKADQYARWRELRALQKQDTAARN